MGLRCFRSHAPEASEGITRARDMTFQVGSESVSFNLSEIVGRFPECARATEDKLAAQIQRFEKELETIEDLEVRLTVLQMYQGIFGLAELESPLSRNVSELLERGDVTVMHSSFRFSRIVDEAKQAILETHEEFAASRCSRKREVARQLRMIMDDERSEVVSRFPEYASAEPGDRSRMESEFVAYIRDQQEERREMVLRLHMHCYFPDCQEFWMQSQIDVRNLGTQIDDRVMRGFVLSELANEILSSRMSQRQDANLEYALRAVPDPEIAGKARLTLRICFNHSDELSNIDLKSATGETQPNAALMSSVAMSFLELIPESRIGRFGLGAAIGEVASLWHQMRAAGLTPDYQRMGLKYWMLCHSARLERRISRIETKHESDAATTGASGMPQVATRLVRYRFLADARRNGIGEIVVAMIKMSHETGMVDADSPCFASSQGSGHQ